MFTPGAEQSQDCGVSPEVQGGTDFAAAGWTGRSGGAGGKGVLG